MEDASLKVVNKKTWNHTKDIMQSNVWAFIFLILLVISYGLGINWKWLALDALILGIEICSAVHHAWKLEEKL